MGWLALSNSYCLTFSGAVASDRALLQQQLLRANRDLRMASDELRRAESADEDMEVSLQAFVVEATAAGLVDSGIPTGELMALEALRAAVSRPTNQVALDDIEAGQREELARRRENLREQLYQVGVDRSTLESLGNDEVQYETVLSQQVSRLRSLELMGTDVDGSASDCPICGSHLSEEDPTVAELNSVAAELRGQAGTFAVNRPRRRAALDEVIQRAERIRSEIRSLDEAIDSIESARRTNVDGRRFSERQAFLQGRISAIPRDS